ncbi:MAG: hypothetical protein JRG71_04150 [Deltaproteobacteria bacterium]|nr:hypothetical protein [Deltaproteobacteria bacterium]
MRTRHGMWFCVAALLLTWMNVPAGRSSTEIEWYDNADEETAVPFYQYLLLNVNNIDDNGLSFRGYGRAADDLDSEEDVDSRLYYAFLEKKGLWNTVDVRLGRQFISTSAGASIMDGLHLTYHDLGPFDVTLFGGGDVAYYEGYNAEDLIGGIELSGTFFDGLQLGASYLQKWDQSELANELIGLDLDYDLNQMLHLYSETQFDYLASSVSYFLGGIRYHQNANWSVRGEYLYSLPVFSSTSIYSVFAVNEYQEIFVEADCRLGHGLRSFINYSREIYQEDTDANVIEAGIEKIRTDRYSGYLSGIWRSDPDGQDLVGFKIYGSAVICRSFQCGAGLNLDVLERYIDDNEDDTTSSRAWVDGTVTISRTVNVQAKLERVESDLWDEYYRGRVRLNVRF